MNTSYTRDVLKNRLFPWVVCGMLWAATFVQAQSSPPYNGDLIGINTSVSITNKTLSNVGTQIPIILRLWGRFVITNTAVGPTAFPRLRMNLNAEEEAWATLDPTTGVEWFTESGLKTRVTFNYAIREGDMVAKLKIAGADGSDAAGAGYGFDWGTYRLVSNTNSLLDAVWRFATSNVEFPGYDPTHYDFSYRNVAIKTLQFGSTPSPVQVGESVTWSVTTANPVSAGRTVNCYVWVSNSVPTGGDVNLDGVKAKQLTINAGGTTAPFQLTGLTAGTNTVYLQGTQDYGNNATKGVLNFEARQIIVTPAPPPYVSVRLQEVPDPTFQRVPESASSSAGKLRVRFSQAHTQDVWVRLDTALNTIPQTPQSNNLIFTTSPYYALVLAGQTESGDVTFRAPDGTLSSDLYGVAITPVLTNATGFFTGAPVGCVVAVSNVVPVVTTPKSTDSLTATRGVPFRFTWNVTDVAADVVSGMSVTWKFDDASAWVTTNGAAGEIFHTYNDVGPQTVRIRAVDKDGAESAEVQFTVTVVEPVPAPSVSLVFDRTPARYGESLDYNTGWVKIQLSKSFSSEDVLVQLSTLPAGQSNVQLAFTDPVTIARGTTLSEEIPFSLLDGTLASAISGITIKPAVITPAASNYYTDVRSSKVYVTNMPPRIVAPVAAADLTAPAAVPFNAVPMGQPFAFDWEIEDVAADASPMVINWDFGDGTTLSVTNGLTGRIYHTYSSLGDKVATVRAIDKDGASSTLVKFKVTVVTPPPLPTVYVRPPAGALDETMAVGTGSIDVELSEAFTSKVTVLLTVDPLNSTGNGAILLATNVVEFRAGEVLKTVKVSARDGTSLSEMSGFVVAPTVQATAAAAAHYTELVPGVVYVRNVAPVIRTPTDPTSPTEIAYTIPQGTAWTYYWDIQDVVADLAGMTVTWYFGDGLTSVTNGGSGSVSHMYDATGTMTVRMVAQDKDGGRDEVQFKVIIAPAKTVLVTPIGPNYEANYWGASGLGNGMVFSEDALGWINRNNVYFFRYGPGVSSAALRAVPYKTGASGVYTVMNYLNDGTAVAGATNDMDSFFYVWVGEDQGLPAQDLVPAQAGPTTAVTLPAAATGTGGTSSSVDIRIIQAIFSREYRKADNMGDINQDGIPDKIATLYNLPSAASGDTGTGTDTGSTPIELAAVGNFNGDKDAAGNVVGDFLPGAASGGGAIIGGLSNVFASVGDPFTAFLEVRGFHAGLNNAQYNSDDDFGEGETDRSCERPTNPTLQDTDGDLFPDGWEYYFWYNSKVKGVTGLAYTPTNVAVGTLIPTRVITTAFDPIVPATDNATGAAVNRDLDNDGLSDIEELSIGTNPIQWDTDFDGICDGWEVLRGLNPNDQRDALNEAMNNPDGDYMAYATVPRILVTLASGMKCLVPEDAVLVVDEALGEIAGTTRCYQYGGTNALYAVGRALTGVAAEIVASVEPIDALILHNQVYQEFGFDPRVAWAGTVNPLSNPQRFPPWVAGYTAEGVVTAPNTKPFTSLDEYLLLKYMSELRLNGATEAIGAGTAQQKTADWTAFSTHPKTPDSDVEWGANGAVAKTDRMPDGWELYVSAPQGWTRSDLWISPWDPTDGDWTIVGEDELSNVREFHGTDCSGGYTNIALYGAAYPVVTIIRPAGDAAWVNKFWPTSPWIGDTDGDGMDDDTEMAFVYGAPVDNGTTCTPGGGLNPCAMDTDSDQLPDAWENEFAYTATPVTPGATTNGMNGTVSDWNQDGDRDGLPNYQEYWVQAVRGLRYDCYTNIPMDGSLGPVAFFTEVTNVWDFCRYPWGDAHPPLWVLLQVGHVPRYVSTDPRDPDTDGDGMDDFYEMFHGLNPILGDTSLVKGDRIREAYVRNGMYTIDYGSGYPLGNAWGGRLNPIDMNFITFPWLTGLDEADPDADGLRNMEEQLQADSAAPAASNTDPSPLWMTDSSSTNSVTRRYYGFGYMFFWPGDRGTLMTMDQIDFKMFSFEMNEGYDTDNDGLSDKAELLQTATSQSDPRDHDDPRRRQALWFSGSESAAQTMYTQPESVWAFRSFTVELWARPETVISPAGQVLIERPVIYGASDLSTPTYLTRLNFRIGIAPDGRVYAMYQNAGAHDAHTGEVVAYGRVLTANEWVRIVARMDAQEGTFQLFVDQEPPISVGTALIPANGVINVLTDPDSGQYPAPNFLSITPAVLVLGAANFNTDLSVTFPPWDAYGRYFRGYIDEVRVWDGARTPEEIRADYSKRYSKDELLANRRAVAESQYAGGTRVEGATPQLPPELVYHYTFDNLFGADRAESVAKVPRGFNYPDVTVNRPWNSVVGWWSSDFAVPTRSTIYDDYGYIPWIENGVDHLPIFGGRVQDGTNVVVRDANTVRDSVYWSHYSAGVLPTPASAHLTNGISMYSFPNENDPYGFWYKHSLDLETTEGAGDKIVADLLPLGGAWAKQALEMWDNDAPASVWADQAVDDDADGLADWWEADVATNYFTTAMGWYDLASNGMTAGELYMRDLAKGYTEGNHPGGAGYNPATLVKQTSDIDGDGLPDWWENLFNLNPTVTAGIDGAMGDPDRDGLSNYAEYLISDAYSLRVSRPDRYRTSATQTESDYFVKAGLLYYGQMFSDHDFMEDAWEDNYDAYYVNRYVYDPHMDWDQDGWSNWSECRFGASALRSDPTLGMHLNPEQDSVKDFPVPVIQTRISYNGIRPIGNLMLFAYSDPGMDGAPDAVWRVQTSAGAAVDSVKSLGYWGAKTIKGFLSPGTLVPGTVLIEMVDSTDNPSLYSVLAGHDIGNASGMSGVIYGQSGAGLSSPIGTINYITGEYEIDLGWFKGMTLARMVSPTLVVTAVPDNSYVKITYQSSQVVGWPKTLYLSDAEVPSATLPSRGYVSEGINHFFAMLDLNNNGVWDAGEPCGVSDTFGVDIGYDRNIVNIELTDYTPGFLRMTLIPPQRSEDIFEGSAVQGGGGGTTLAGLEKRIVVKRSVIDGNKSYQDIVLEKTLSSTRSFVHEGDLLEQGDLGLDWGLLNVPTAMDRLTAVYEVYLGNNTVLTNAVLAFTNRFDNVRAKAQSVYPSGNGYVYSSRPTFKWSMPRNYTAFTLEIRKFSSTGPVVYNSGAVKAPARDIDGNCVWTAPVYAGMRAANGQIYASNVRYAWRVSALDAKFSDATVSPNWSDWQVYRLDVNPPLDSSGYGAIKAVVKYHGPATAMLANRVKVQVFHNAAFTGLPEAELTLAGTGLTVLTDPASTLTNAVVCGLAPSVEAGDYYVRAFIDHNDNGVRDVWESWGYACSYGVNDTPYDPFPVKVKYVPLVQCETVVIHIEDADSDQDWFPDAWEFEQNPTEADFLALSGPGDASNDDPDYEMTNPNLLPAAGLSAPSLFTALALGTTDADQDGLGDLAELVLGSNAQSASTAGDGLTDGTKLGLGLAPADTLAVDVTGLSLSGTEASVQWSMAVQKAEDASRALLSSLAPATGTVRYEVLFTPSLQAPDWQVVAGDEVTLESGTDGLSTRIERTQQALQAAPAQGFFRIRLVD